MSIFINGIDRTPVNSLVLLNAAAGNEVANRMDYTINKAAGNDTGFVINKTDILSSGTSLIIDFQKNGTSLLTLGNRGEVISTVTLNAATGNETAFTLNYTSNKATSGDDTGLEINQTDTLSPGTSYGINYKVGGNSKFFISNDGGVNAVGIITGNNLYTGSQVRTSGGVTLNLQQVNFSSSDNAIEMSQGTFSGAGVTQAAVVIMPTYNQSTTSAATDLKINRTVTAVGSGAQLLIDAQVGSTSWYKFASGNTATTGGFNAASGTEYGVTLSPIINQSGTAGWVGLYVNPTLTAVGSGAQISAQFTKGVVAYTPNDAAGSPVAATSPMKAFLYNASKADDAVITCPAITTSAYGIVILGTAEEYARFIVNDVGTVTLLDTSANVVANADTDTKLCIGTAATQEPLQIKNRLGGVKVLNVMMWYD